MPSLAPNLQRGSAVTPSEEGPRHGFGFVVSEEQSKKGEDTAQKVPRQRYTGGRDNVTE